jgi:hypothetical protein
MGVCKRFPLMSNSFLDDHSLGTTLATTDAVPFVGIEDYFMPAELDDLIASLNTDSIQLPLDQHVSQNERRGI